MHILYIDESGDLGAMPKTPNPSGNDQPVLVIGGLVIDSANIEPLTHDFIALKHRFFPGLPASSVDHLDKIIPEIKGADLRRNLLRGSKRSNRHAIGLLSNLISLLEQYNIKLLARIWVKELGAPFHGRPVYTSSVQWLYASFNRFLADHESTGFCIADSRDHIKNVNVAHSIFTQKFRPGGAYGHIPELPTFGHSENHAILQICDIVCSAMLFPIASLTYCANHFRNVHVQPRAETLRARFGTQLEGLQYRYQSSSGKWQGGLTVSDPLGHQNAVTMLH